MPEPIGHDVLALFEDSMTAHEAILALERSGIEGGRIRLVADATELGVAELTQRADANLERTVLPRAILGAGIGAVVGAVIGIVAIALSDGVGFGAVIGAVLLVSAIGGLIGAFTRLGASDAWTDTLAADRSASVVAVTSNDHAALQKATELLAHAHGLQRIVQVGGPRE